MFSLQMLAASPIRGVVGQGHGLGGGAEGHRHQHRAEDLHLGDRGGGGHAGEQGRREEVALARQAPGGLPHRGPLGHPLIHQTSDSLQLHRRHDRPDVHRLVHAGRPSADAPCAPATWRSARSATFSCTSSREPAQQTSPWLNQIASTTPFDDAIQIGIVEDQERRLATKFQRDALAGAGRGPADQPTHLGRSGEGDLVHIGMVDQHLAGPTVPGYDVHHPRRQPHLGHDLGEGGGR